MADQPADPPEPPDLPAYLLDPLERQSPDRLERIASYAQALAAWKRAQHERDTAQRQAAEAISDDERAGLDDRGISTDPEDYEAVPSGAYITIKRPNGRATAPTGTTTGSGERATHGRTSISRQSTPSEVS
jgi:hypothetical protein